MITTIATKLQNSEQRAEQMLAEGTQSSEMHSAYNELDVRSEFRADVLVQLKANIAELEDLHARLRFMMGEISYLMKKY